jgi:Protein of unknown function (DUF4231)
MSIMYESKEEYLERVRDQISWHSVKAREAKKRNALFQTLVIVASTLIPIVNTLTFDDATIRITSAILGGVIAGSTWFIRINRYEDNWISYVLTGAKLRKEQLLFLNSAGGYADSKLSPEDRQKLFVQNVEGILESDVLDFVSKMRSKSENDKLQGKA